MLINIHTHNITETHGVLEIPSFDVSEFQPNFQGYFSIGNHPWYTSSSLQLEAWASEMNCLAIGECGIDKLRGGSLNEQIEILNKQIELSEKLQKPLILHVVKGFNDILSLRKSRNPSQPWIIHGFRKNLDLGVSLCKAGCYLSFGEALMQERVQDIFKHLPQNQLFLETDNSSFDIATMYEFASTAMGFSLEQTENIFSRNFNQVFKQDAEELVRKSGIVNSTNRYRKT